MANLDIPDSLNTKLEKRIYSAIFKHQMSSAEEIIKQTRLPDPIVHITLASLLDKLAISFTKEEGVKRYLSYDFVHNIRKGPTKQGKNSSDLARRLNFFGEHKDVNSAAIQSPYLNHLLFPHSSLDFTRVLGNEKNPQDTFTFDVCQRMLRKKNLRAPLPREVFSLIFTGDKNLLEGNLHEEYCAMKESPYEWFGLVMRSGKEEVDGKVRNAVYCYENPQNIRFINNGVYDCSMMTYSHERVFIMENSPFYFPLSMGRLFEKNPEFAEYLWFCSKEEIPKRLLRSSELRIPERISPVGRCGLGYDIGPMDWGRACLGVTEKR